MLRLLGSMLITGILAGWCVPASSALTQQELAPQVIPPMQLGPRDDHLPVWQILNSGGALSGFIFETAELTPIPGFSGSPMNLLVSIDTEGRFIDIKVLDQNEPVFVSGLGARPFHQFVYQYRGKSLASNIKVLPAGTKRGDLSAAEADTYIDGVTKATASVRIANKTILASALKVAREKLANIAPRPAGHARQDLFESMSWQELQQAGLVRRLHITNRQIQQAFKDTPFTQDDPTAVEQPDALYLDLWVADLNIPSVAGNLLTESALQTLRGQLEPTEEPILVVANGRHPLVADDFVRNSTPDRMLVYQQGFPISIRDADAEIEFRPGIPLFDQAMILRIDTRFGFNPAEPWTFVVKAMRQHGSFRPTLGSQELRLEYAPHARFFEQAEETSLDTPLWLVAWQDKAWELLILALFLGLLSYLLHRHRALITRPQRLAWTRYSLLLFTLLFIGWSQQGQLSIVTVDAFIRALFQTHDFTFLLFDPISLLLWIYTLATLILWGRGTFCGWLCPFGVLQEFTHTIGTKLRIRPLKLSPLTNRRLGGIKYLILAALIGSLFISPPLHDRLLELEPFKTAITLTFQREWPYLLYALACILISMAVYKGYCRFLCPLGAALVIGGRLRRRNWLIRRAACGTPCKYCHVTCRYDAIDRESGSIRYDACFQCLECVEIYDDPLRCVPLVQRSKRQVRANACKLDG